MTRQPRPVRRLLPLVDALLGGAPLVIEAHDRAIGEQEIRDDEAHAREQLAQSADTVARTYLGPLFNSAHLHAIALSKCVHEIEASPIRAHLTGPSNKQMEPSRSAFCPVMRRGARLICSVRRTLKIITTLRPFDTGSSATIAFRPFEAPRWHCSDGS